MKHDPNDPVELLCTRLGCNLSELARRCNMTRQAIHCWRTNGVSAKWAYFFIANSAGQLTMQDLRPNDYKGFTGSVDTPAQAA